MGRSIGSHQRRWNAISSPPPHSIFHHGDSKTRWNNLLGGLAVSMTAGPSGQTNSPHPSSREGHHSTVGGSSISSYRISSCPPLKPLRLPSPPGTRSRHPTSGACQQPTDPPA